MSNTSSMMSLSPSSSLSSAYIWAMLASSFLACNITYSHSSSSHCKLRSLIFFCGVKLIQKFWWLKTPSTVWYGALAWLYSRPVVGSMNLVCGNCLRPCLIITQQCSRFLLFSSSSYFSRSGASSSMVFSLIHCSLSLLSSSCSVALSNFEINGSASLSLLGRSILRSSLSSSSAASFIPRSNGQSMRLSSLVVMYFGAAPYTQYAS
mmetsp:Transcript_15435/g.15294  ORF Transcript_15435/g.15294 Transcript_15435/m.15294 type:complete len:207 (-) Transcript_15435:465-1085(-)